jgi:hypothetical protein
MVYALANGRNQEFCEMCEESDLQRVAWSKQRLRNCGELDRTCGSIAGQKEGNNWSQTTRASNPSRKGETWIVALSIAKLLKRLACHIGFPMGPVQSDESKLSTKGRGTCIVEKGQVTNIVSLNWKEIDSKVKKAKRLMRLKVHPNGVEKNNMVQYTQ